MRATVLRDARMVVRDDVADPDRHCTIRLTP